MIEEKSLLRVGIADGDALRALRRCGNQRVVPAGSSFNPDAARRMGAYRDGEPDVNPNDLGNGKDTGRIVGGNEDDGTSGDRGKE